jgi:hypothetical protein
MKKLFIILSAASFFAISCNNKSTEKAPTEDSTKIVSNQFGIKFENLSPMLVADVANQVKEGKEFNGVMEGKIVDVCQKAGCWANLELPDGKTMKVKFRDAKGEEYGIDINSVGKTIDVHGVGYMDTISVAMLKHYAEDAKASKEELDAITEPKISAVFKADGAILK